MEKETDIDVLARMIAEGFDSMEKRFETVDDRFESMDVQFNEIKSDIKELQKEVRETNHRIDTVLMPTLDEHAHRIKMLEEQSV